MGKKAILCKKLPEIASKLMDKTKKFQKVYEEQSDAIFRYCLFRVSERETAIDIMQESFMRYWDSLSKREKIDNDKAFLFTIARNLVIDWYRKKKSVSLEAMNAKYGDDNDDFDLSDGLTLNDLELSAEARTLIGKINLLQPTNRQVVYLRYVEDLGPKEIAQILKLSPNVVSVRINRGIEELKKLVGYDK